MSASELPPVTIPRSTQRTMHAEDGSEYSVLVAWPSEPAPASGHPVVCLVDPARSFGMLVDSIRMRSRRPDATSVVPAVVVGVSAIEGDAASRARRTLDFTASPPSDGGGEADAAAHHPAGGAPRFHDFIRHSVIPFVERDHHVDPSRVALAGHSLGGLFVLESLLLAPGAFASYVSISPSIWWARERLMAGAAALSERGVDVDVHICVGEYDQEVAPWQRRREAAELESLVRRREQRSMVTDARNLAARLGGPRDAAPRVHFHMIPGEDHASVVPVAFGRVLRSVLAPV